MQSRQEDFESFNVNYYWEEILEQEKAGNKFLELINDGIDYEKHWKKEVLQCNTFFDKIPPWKFYFQRREK